MRVLLVTPEDRSARTAWFFYAFHNHLLNGFTRGGHFVVTMRERETFQEALGVKPLAKWLANRRLRELAKEFHPDLLCLHMSYLITGDTLRAIKREFPHCRVAVTWYDAIQSAFEVQRFEKALEIADFAFVTTGGADLARFSGHCPLAFIPNPVDVSIFNVRAYAGPEKTWDVFCALRKRGRTDRWGLIDELMRLKPNLAYGIFGRDKQNLLYGSAYVQAIARSKVGLNLNKVGGDLYSSDRMAQFLGSGLLVATHRGSGYARYFDEREMIFFDDAADLAEKIERAVSDDKRWREMAERGRAKALEIMGETRITDFIMSMVMGLGVPSDWPYADHVFLGTTRDKQ